MATVDCDRIHKEICGRANLNNRTATQDGLAVLFKNTDYWMNRQPKDLAVKHFATFLEYVEHRSPYGLEWKKKILEAFLRPEREELWQKIEAQIPASNPHGVYDHNKKEDIIYNVSTQGTSRSYSIATLKRDAPDIAEKVINGEISAAKGMVMAGKRTPTVTCKVSVQGFYDAIHRKLDPHEIDLLKAML